MRDSKKPTTSGHVFKRIHKGSGPSRLIGQILEKTNTNSARSAQTLGHMIEGLKMGLEMTCQGCGEAWRPNPADLLDQFGAEAPLTGVALPCPACASTRVHAHPVGLRP